MRARWAYGFVLLLAACNSHQPPPARTPPAVITQSPEPKPPAGAAPNLAIAERDSSGRFVTINSNIGAQEALWHVRGALNVAALSCSNAPSLTASYNRFLKENKAALTQAYRSESGDSALRDRHMTQLYNYFSQPPAQFEFCKVAKAEAERAVATSPGELTAYAPAALARLEAPITDFYRAYAAYRQDLTAWRDNPHRALASAKAEAPPALVASSIGNGWRIQIGAFTGKDAALAAWSRAKQAAPGLAEYNPRFEAVQGRTNLVRLQVGSADDRSGALKLCAVAAAGGFDCIPIPISQK